jgi:hypothetical protein
VRVHTRQQTVNHIELDRRLIQNVPSRWHDDQMILREHQLTGRFLFRIAAKFERSSNFVYLPPLSPIEFTTFATPLAWWATDSAISRCVSVSTTPFR